MMMIDESEPLPPLYANWLAELLGGSVPRERHASCDSCAMCAGSGQQLGSNYYFNPSVKCCTYHPNLPNFLVGRILSDDDPAALPGRKAVEKAIEEGLAVTPLGVGMPPKYSVLYRNGANAFGRSESLRCPYFIEDGGRCGIWRNRKSTCITWFCKHVRGKVGLMFWQDSLHPLLRAVERDLARWCVLEHQFGDDALRHLAQTGAWTEQPEPLAAASMDNKVEEGRYARIWDKWRGCEIDFFIRCAKLVGELSWKDVLTVSSPETRAYARLTKQAYVRLTSDEIPPRLRVGAMKLSQIGQEKTRVETYSILDPIDVTNVVMDLLQYFDGRPTEEILGDIANKRELRLNHSLVRKLVDFELLVPPDSQNTRALNR
jgi:hypothetical protein